MSKSTWVLLCIFIGLILFKLQSGRRSAEEVSVMRKAVNDGGLLLDVRTPGEYNGGHLDGALNIPVGDLRGRLQELGPKERAIVVYCASGGRSARATKFLRANGFNEVHDLGSLSNW
ncbi:MAG: sulfurtransferase [Myxococcales bacterium]|nr:sulfurtransferase [Myxococcales bacterium]|tara:strand:- start:345 stop:695 length:351 start_codon:yes stop_codon:yes gene_type:complete